MKNLLLSILAFIALLVFGPSGAQAQSNLALQGYDTVAYFTAQRAMPGNPKFQYEWDGAVYQFASADHLAMFTAEPDRYLPQYNSWCTASVAKGVKVRPNPQNWLIVGGRLYLFGKPIGPDLMRKDSEGMKRRADDKWPKVSQLPNPD
jgi:YHS domain-containing protein